MATESVAKPTLTDAADQEWKDTGLPAHLAYLLARLDRCATGALGMSEMLQRDDLADRERDCMRIAMREMLFDMTGQLEEIQDHARRQFGAR